MEIQDSLKKILASEDVFGTMFYDIYFDRCPAAREYFLDSDMRRQSLILTMALTLIEQHYNNEYAAVEQYLQHVGNKHSDRKIPRDLYVDWRDSMLAALESFHGEDWNQRLSEQWRDAIEAVTETMFQGYDERTSI